MLVGLYFGFRRIKIKRYVENIPTSLSSGLCYGPSELKGHVVFWRILRLQDPKPKEVRLLQA